MSVRLFVGNLPYDTSEAELREHFAAVAPPMRVSIPLDRDTGRPRGFAFVEFGDRSVAEEVIRQFDTQPFKGRGLSISEARPKQDRPGEGRPAAPSPRPMGDTPPALEGPPREAAPRRASAPASRRAESPRRPRQERPKGPIRERGGGRLYSVDDDDVSDDLTDFENFATSAPDGHDEDE